MKFPEFYASAPVIRVHDPLANFLGAAADGVLEYRYEDVVRLAGHSCPTVASAFLMVRAGLLALFGAAIPVRGEIRVEFSESSDAGVTGVIASVTTLITGATAETGFKGLAGQFNRRNRLFFSQPIKAGSLRLIRMDSGQAVQIGVNLAKLPADPRMPELISKCLQGIATQDEQNQFQTLWQNRVKSLLIDHADDPEVIQVSSC